MPKVISPEDFVSAFDQAARLEPHVQTLAENWKNGKRWGEALCVRETGILAGIARSLDLDYRREYAKIDAVFYERVPVEEGVARLYSLAVAIEDEGLAKDSTWELNQLATTNVPLKVLVTYPRKAEEAAFRVRADPTRIGHVPRLRVNGVVSWPYFKFTEPGFERIEPGRQRGRKE